MSIGRDGIAGLVLLAVSLVLFLVVQACPPKLPIVPIGPGFYPRIVLAFMAAASALLVSRTCRTRCAPAQPAARAPQLWLGGRSPSRSSAATWRCCRCSAFASPPSLFVAALQALSTGREAAAMGGCSLASRSAPPAASTLVFERYLLVLLPRGAGRASDMLELLGHGLVTILQWKYLLPLFAARWSAWSAARCRASPSP